MSTFKEVNKGVGEFFKNLKANLEKDPRYLINHLADKNGELRIYFASVEQYNLYKEGKATIGSTERFFSTDPFCMIPKERIEKITDGMTLAHIREEN
jgi:hypothetical protein